jgi:nitrite reductase/ring-hydroxylating ferredoxin subunit
LVTSLPAIASGLTDSQDTYGHERRANMVHGLTMTLAVSLMAGSLGLRWWAGLGLHPLAVGIATVGLVVAMGGMYVGGHLTFAMGTMVNRSAFFSGPADFVRLGASGDFPEGALRRVEAGGLPVVVVRRGGQLYAMGAVCSHAGGPLEEGELDGTIVTCPWHGSRFDMSNGHAQRGPATFGQPRLIVRETGGVAEAKLEHPLP